MTSSSDAWAAGGARRPGPGVRRGGERPDSVPPFGAEPQFGAGTAYGAHPAYGAGAADGAYGGHPAGPGVADEAVTEDPVPGGPPAPRPRVAHLVVPATKRRADLSECQDASLAAVFGARAVLCVADGVGSAPFSAIGAHVAVVEFVRALSHCTVPDADTALEAVTGARAAWEARLRDHAVATGDASPRSYAATVCYAVTGAGWAVLGAIGDCFGVVMRAADPPEFHLIPDQGRGGGYANETVTLASPDWADLAAERLYVLRDPGLCGVLLSTDGLEAVSVRHGRRRTGERAGEVVQVGIQPGVVDRLLTAVRDLGATGEDLAGALAGNAEVMQSKGDDIGVAIATW